MHTSSRILAASMLLVFVASIVDGATFTAETSWLDDESSVTLDASFDFGFRFTTIERVTLEVRSSQASINGYCNSSCSFWSLGAKVVPTGDVSVFSTQPQLPELGTPVDYSGAMYVHHFEALSVVRDYLMQGNVSPPIEFPEGADIADATFRQLPWPDFLRSGAGEIHLASVNSWSCYLNCGEVVSRVGVSRPMGISELRIIVDGVAAPEPTSMSILIGTLAIAGCDRRVMRAGLVRCIGEGKQLAHQSE